MSALPGAWRISNQAAVSALKLARYVKFLIVKRWELIKSHPFTICNSPLTGSNWLRGDAAFANPDIYEYCEKKRITYFIRLRANACPTVSRTKVDGESIRNKSLLSSQSHIPQWRSSKIGFIEYIRKWIRNYPIFFVSVKGLEGTIFGLIIGYFIWGCEK